MGSGISSGVERHPPKVEVAGSNPVSRSGRRFGGEGCESCVNYFGKPHFFFVECLTLLCVVEEEA